MIKGYLYLFVCTQHSSSYFSVIVTIYVKIILRFERSDINIHFRKQKRVCVCGGGGLPFSGNCFKKFVILSLNLAVSYLYNTSLPWKVGGANHTMPPPHTHTL